MRESRGKVSDDAVPSGLLRNYESEQVGTVVLRKAGSAVVLDVGEWTGEVGVPK